MALTYAEWEQRRRGVPQTDRVLPLVTAAGATGMTWKQLASAVPLDRQLLDDLLSGLVSTGLLAIAWEGGFPVYRSISGTAQALSPPA